MCFPAWNDVARLAVCHEDMWAIWEGKGCWEICMVGAKASTMQLILLLLAIVLPSSKPYTASLKVLVYTKHAGSSVCPGAQCTCWIDQCLKLLPLLFFLALQKQAENTKAPSPLQIKQAQKLLLLHTATTEGANSLLLSMCWQGLGFNYFLKYSITNFIVTSMLFCDKLQSLLFYPLSF